MGQLVTVVSPIRLLPPFLFSEMSGYFPGIPKIRYNKDAKEDDTLCYKYYDASEMIMGRSMEDWLRFSSCFWHSFRGTGSDAFGQGTITRSWDDGTESLDNYKRRLSAAFEFYSKLGIKYWSFHDRDISPEGTSLEESNAMLDEMTDFALELQQQTGIKLLWNTCNLFAHPRYAYAAAQVKKGLDVAKKLGALNFVFWGGREGYNSLLNTNINHELNSLAKFYRMALNYKEKIGFEGQMLIEPKPKEPTRHQYDYDAMTVIGFLRQFDLIEHFKLNIEPNHTTLAGHPYEHDIVLAAELGMLGSIDTNTGSPDMGWDTDQFPMDIRSCTAVMKTVIEKNGMEPGGLNFDAKLRRESTDTEDLFVAHIGAMDAFARGLRNAARLIEDGIFAKNLRKRYGSFEFGFGQKLSNGSATLEDCEKFVREHGEPGPMSAKQEHLETIFNRYL